MRLATLFASLSDEELERLAVEHVPTDEKLPRPQLYNFLEGALRSYRFVSDFIVNRQPPTFAILASLLDSPGYELPIEAFRERVMMQTRKIAELIDSGELLSRDRQLQLYRKAFYEARRNDADINASEAALLAVLRREQGIAQVEHFLLEHHQDLREFWDREDSYAHEENALRSAGLLFHINGQIVIPEEVAPAMWQSLGIDMPTESARRLFGHLSNGEFAEILEAAGSRISGSKEMRLERIMLERIQPREALRIVSLTTLKEICRATDAASTGNKDELIERVIAHFAQGRDQHQEAPPETRLPEARQLDQGRFETLFGALHHQELSDILRRRPELRQTGTKETKIRTLWVAQLSEMTLLSELMNRQLEDVLHRLELRLAGSKNARIERLVMHFRSSSPADTAPAENSATPQEPHASAALSAPEVEANQELFRQRGSNPQGSLQPWLDELLNAGGLVRCYATEDANPSKQLKNKLSQAAAVRDGLLVLILADEEAYLKAREALSLRWMANAEWPKSVACVALGYPLASPGIVAMVERVGHPWSRRIQALLFPDAKIVSVADQSAESGASRCVQCQHELPSAARYCPNCGTAVGTGATLA